MKDRLRDLTALCHDIIIAPVESNAFLEEFLPKVNEVQQLIERISLCVEEVKLRHSTILTEINPPNYLEGKFSENENANSSSVYCRIQSTQHTVLSLRFAEIMNMYNQELLSFRTRSKDWIQRQLEISGKVITEEETEVLLQSNTPAVFTSNINSGSCITGQALNEIELRHKDILYLEASIRELHSMFMDIAMLVNSQSEMANNIAKTVMKAGSYVDQGKENMEKAVDYKKSWGIRLHLFKSKAKPATSKGS
ncbi:syntaxin-2-like isoform X2 [Sinocyclocheilus rhinocerous]|uniref:syntaxin-2-like isoform X2 n=1 Tax=Sinocyclocheilus rhinocerous TaxID=307959 RepID=UPI0007BABB1C|nr:PREDICTED: syntaxin-2-like isoform X2 [Sinocyclocheilus rhinocerous]